MEGSYDQVKVSSIRAPLRRLSSQGRGEGGTAMCHRVPHLLLCHWVT
jgi:hypothetical protein